MEVLKSDRHPLQQEQDIVLTRQWVRQNSMQLGFSLVDQTKLVTAASELARNTIKYGGGGSLLLETLKDGFRKGLRLTFEDKGQGIPNLEEALRDGYSTGGGLGLGLGGAKRLSNEFKITSVPGQGTTVTIARWT